MRKRTLLTAIALVALAAVVATTSTAANARKASKEAGSAVQVDVFAPRKGDVAGKLSKGSSSISHSGTQVSRRVGPTSS